MGTVVTYRTAAGAMRRLAVPEIDGVEPAAMLAGVVKQALADSGPVAAVRLIAPADPGDAEGAEQATKQSAESAADGKSKH